MNIGLLVLRLVVGLLFMGHGAQKLFGWIGGHGIEGTGQFFGSMGYRPGQPMAALAGLAEFGGGLLLAMGLLTPLGCAAIIGVMVSATLGVHLPKGVWNTNGGYEFPVVMATVAAALALGGPGKFSMDGALGLGTGGHLYGVWAILGGLLAGLALNAWRAANLRSQARRRAQASERRAA